LAEAKEELASSAENSDDVRAMLNFINNSTRGILR
jgi:acyl-[acyl carrier protein]--UDP-N-acetylglucosamine O-acyltransferase